MNKQIRVISIEYRSIGEEAERILMTANSMFDEPKYKIRWIEVSEDGENYKYWAILDKKTDVIYESFDDDNQDCVVIAERALKIAAKECDRLYGKNDISSEAQKILDEANKMFEEDARYKLNWSREKNIHGKIWYCWRIFDSRKNRTIIPKGSIDDQSCVEMAREALASAKRSASSGSKKYYDGKGKPPVHKSFSFSHDLYQKMEKESKLRGLDIKEFMVKAVEKMVEELEQERESRKGDRK